MNNFYDLWDDPEARLPLHTWDGEWAAIEAEQRAEWRVLNLRAAGEIRLATEFSAARAEYDRLSDNAQAIVKEGLPLTAEQTARLEALGGRLEPLEVKANAIGRRLYAYRMATKAAANMAARRARARVLARYEA